MKRKYAYIPVLTFAAVLALGACAPRGDTQPGPVFRDQHEPSTSQGVFPEPTPPAE